MKDSKPKSLNKNKIILYQTPLFDRIMAIFTFTFLSLLGIYSLISDMQDKGNVMFLIIIIIFGIGVRFMHKKTYLLFDPEDNIFIAKHCGATQMSILISDIKSFKLSYHDKQFNLNIVLKNGDIVKDIRWWNYYDIRKASLFASHERQADRLYEFCEECNAYLESRDKKIG
jgi:hypothetical protein